MRTSRKVVIPQRIKTNQNKMISNRIILCILFLLASTMISAQLFKKQLNEYGEDGLKTGKWKLYWDEEEKIPMSLVNYENGKEKGVSKEFHNNGSLRLKFRHHKSRIRVKYFSPERKLEQKGWAVFEYNAEDTHYFWEGKWKFYDEKRKLITISRFENGELISEVSAGN